MFSDEVKKQYVFAIINDNSDLINDNFNIKDNDPQKILVSKNWRPLNIEHFNFLAANKLLFLRIN